MNILFLCTGNSCRSQMAHGLASKLWPEVTVYSAGTKTHGLNTNAVKVMEEVGVDISHHTSNLLSEYDHITFDIIYTVCSDAHENCPYVPNAKILHVGFDDPPRLTKGMTNEDEILNVYRRVRDEIKTFIERCQHTAN